MIFGASPSSRPKVDRHSPAGRHIQISDELEPLTSFNFLEENAKSSSSQQKGEAFWAILHSA